MGRYFNSLNYTLGNEDASFEMRALPLGARHVVAVADCGSRVVPLLARAPQRLTAVDISPAQLALTRLRMKLLSVCDLTEYKAFLGYSDGMHPSQRERLFEQLELPADVAAILRRIFVEVGWSAPLYLGRFERMLTLLSKVNRAITGRAGQRIFAFTRLDDQLRYLEDGFPHWRWRCLVAVLGNSTALNSLLYRGEFPKRNAEKSYYAAYTDIFRRLLGSRAARESFFLQMLFLGRLKYEEGFPIECDRDTFSRAKAALRSCEIQYFESDILSVVRNLSIAADFVSLSDVPSFFDAPTSVDFLRQLRPGFADGALVVVRGHMRIVSPYKDGYADISENFISLAAQEKTQLWKISVYKAV